ncbi:MAG TPA: urease accessory UreF family protein [Nitrososphaera sp.]|jgi:urease accessory protein|nr:urease accessory UreF family protein [Nitrososphaera sp.]
MSTDDDDATMDAADLSMMQLSDSFFPTGMYSMSNGLEAIFYSGKKIKAEELRELVKTYLEYQIGPADCTALGNAYEHAARSDLLKLLEVDRVIFSMKLVQEIRDASIRSGTQLVRCIRSFSDNKILGQYDNAIRGGQAFGPYPVALAVAANAFLIPKEKAALVMLYSFSVSIVGAALRLGMLQHFDGQKVIDELKPTIVKVTKANINRPIEGIWQFAPSIDIIQISHERMNSKMFIT